MCVNDYSDSVMITVHTNTQNGETDKTSKITEGFTAAYRFVRNDAV